MALELFFFSSLYSFVLLCEFTALDCKSLFIKEKVASEDYSRLVNYYSFADKIAVTEMCQALFFNGCLLQVILGLSLSPHFLGCQEIWRVCQHGKSLQND